MGMAHPRIGCPNRSSLKNWKGRVEGEDPEEAERDLQVLGVRRWRELVANRKKWKDIVQQAKAHSGLYCQWKKKNRAHTFTSSGFSSVEKL